MAALHRDCSKCGRGFLSKASEAARGGALYCSVTCAQVSRTGRPPQPLALRFARASKTENERGCHLWQGKRNASGYGRIKNEGGKEVMAHRVAYEQRFGAIPQGLVVCHRCDEPSCVNPEHLFVGTQLDNLADMHAKGRARGNTTKHTRDCNGRFA